MQQDAEGEEEPSCWEGSEPEGLPGGAEGPDPACGRKQACLSFKALKLLGECADGRCCLKAL